MGPSRNRLSHQDSRSRIFGNMLQMARSSIGRAKRGLYEGKEVRFGNNVSFSKRRTRRNWLPNVQSKRLWSETREKLVEFRMTTHAMRCVKKSGWPRRISSHKQAHIP